MALDIVCITVINKWRK